MRVDRLTPTIVEVVVEAPAAARNFEPGQFYRLQNYEARSKKVDGTLLTMEGLALTGAWVDKDKGLLSLITLEMGGSSDLCALLEPGEPVIVMGPTGTPTEIEPGETVVLAGGGLGNAVLFSIGQAFRKRRQQGALLRGLQEGDRPLQGRGDRGRGRRRRLVLRRGAGLRARRGRRTRRWSPTSSRRCASTPRASWASSRSRSTTPTASIAIGSDGMMNAVRLARHSVLKPYLKPDHRALGSINSPMQCMMKEICAQCLQLHKDPVTGKETVVFSCFNQDQELDRVDFACLRQRLRQNGVQEKIAALWIDRVVAEAGRAAAPFWRV